MTLSQELFHLARFGSGKLDADLIAAGRRAKELEDALWRARADLDNAHREIMPHVNELAHGAIRAGLVVDPPVEKETGI